MDEVNLYTGDGHFVEMVLVPAMSKRPEILGWGSRTFVWSKEYNQYREGLMFVALSEQQHTDLRRGKTVYIMPDDGHTIGSLVTQLSMLGQIHGLHHHVFLPGGVPVFRTEVSGTPDKVAVELAPKQA